MNPAGRTDRNSLKRKFIKYYGKSTGKAPLKAAVSPGRVNLIGEHTDYNGGLVLPVAVDKHIAAVFQRSEGNAIQIVADNLNDRDEIPVRGSIKSTKDTKRWWVNYIRGTAAVLKKHGLKLQPGKIVVTGDLPDGAGLSSSAAVCSATALALCSLGKGKKFSKRDLTYVCQEAEHSFAGVKCGIMDQTAVLCSKKSHAVLLNCKTGDLRHVPVKLKGWAFAVFDTAVRHSLASAEYNKRRQECENAAKKLGVETASDITFEKLLLGGKKLTGTQQKRLRHLLGENIRTAQFSAALQSGNVEEMGHLLNLSHEGLRDDYEVSCKELNCLQELLLNEGSKQRTPSVVGARMVGGGFGGSVVALIRSSKYSQISKVVIRKYKKAIGRNSNSLLLNPGPGADVFSL